MRSSSRRRPFGDRVATRAARGRQAGRVHALELDAHSKPPFEHQQIEFSSGMGSPEVCFVRLRHMQNLLKRKTFPAGPAFGMLPQRIRLLDAPEIMQQAAVANVDFGRLDLTIQ